MTLLTNDVWRRFLAESLDRAVNGQPSRLIAYVFMPEHVHILIQPTVPDFRIELFLKALKAPFSRRIRKQLEDVRSPLLKRLTVRERPGVDRFRFWQEGGGYDRNLRSVKTVEFAIAYIHENPVRLDLCPRSTDWRWSSARHHYGDEQGVLRVIEPPTIHGLARDFHT